MGLRKGDIFLMRNYIREVVREGRRDKWWGRSLQVQTWGVAAGEKANRAVL